MSTKRYIISKVSQPEAFGLTYAENLQYIPDYDRGREVVSRLDGVIEAGPLTPEQAEMVAARPHVRSVEEDVEDTALDPVENLGPFVTPLDVGPDGYDLNARKFHQLDAAYLSGFAGQGVTVAVGDTGIRQTTIERTFQKRVKASRSFISGEAVEDKNGHGDFCCTCACPLGAQLIVGKVLSNAGSGARSGIIAFIAWAVEEGADVISLSLGGGGFSQAYEDVIKAAKDRGVMVFCASGNGGRQNEPVNAPANSPSAIPCGATDQRTEKVADFSCKGPEMAKGFSGAGVQVQYDPPGDTPGRAYSGTSMGTPAVACSYAVTLGAARVADGDQALAMERMIKTCKDTPEPATAEGNGIPQVMEAIREKSPAPAPAPAPLKRKRHERTGYLDLRGIFRMGIEGPRNIWGELQPDGGLKVLDWDDPGMDDETQG